MQAERNERDGIFVVSDKGRVARRHTSGAGTTGKTASTKATTNGTNPKDRDTGKIIRPGYQAVAPRRKYVPIEERTEEE